MSISIMTPKNTVLSATLFFLIVAFGFAVPTGHAAGGERPTEVQWRAVPPDSGRTRRLATPDEIPRGLSSSEWKSIRQSYEAGRRKVFQRAPGAWTARNPGQQLTAEFDGRAARIKTDGGTHLGLKLVGYGFSADTVVVGANREDSAATGVNGNQADNSESNSGAAYLFFLPAVGSSPVNVNDRVTFTPTTQSVTGIAGSCAGLGYTNQYNLNVDLRNIGANTLSSPFFSVAELQESGGPVPANPSA